MQPFRILFIGDFSNRGDRLDRARDLEFRKPFRIDRDSIGPVMSHLNIALTLTDIPNHGDISLEFQDIDDFHPDWILKHLPKGTEQPHELTKDSSSPARISRRTQAPSVSELTSGSLLDAAVSETEQTQGTPRSSDPLRQFVNQLVSPYEVKKGNLDAQRNESVENRSAEALREILHRSEFQKLEAAWRALSLVASRLETDEALQLFVLDLTRTELIADIGSTDDLRSTELFRIIAGEADRWALIAADFAFGGEVEDLELLRRIGLLCGSAGAPVLAEAKQTMLGCDSVAATPNPREWKNDVSHSTAWKQLRGSAVAQWIGLAAPRFLVRMPYGERGTTVDSFPFEEMPSDHREYLWASPVYLCAMLIGQAFAADEWDLRPGLFQNVSSLPLYIKYSEEGAEAMPVAEALLTEFAGDRILDLGIMPLMSFKDQDTVRLMRFQSLADPLAPLAGKWQ
jgi:type VI secretion system protein ImpC